jgi:hypothetical protein
MGIELKKEAANASPIFERWLLIGAGLVAAAANLNLMLELIG